MATKKAGAEFKFTDALIHAFGTNNRINEYLIAAIPPDVWNAQPAGGKGRSIAAIAAHLHNVRLMWLKSVGGIELPGKLDPETVKKEEVASARQQSCRALQQVLQASLEADGRVKGFKPDVVSFFSYLIAHDGHHRGQMIVLARQLGAPVSQSVISGDSSR